MKTPISIYQRLGYSSEQTKILKEIIGSEEKIVRRFTRLIQTPAFRPVWNKIHSGKQEFEKVFKEYRMAKILGLEKKTEPRKRKTKKKEQ